MAKTGERKAQILQTLAGMLEDPKGERITTALLAARLDVSEAALYRHFASKAQMFEGLIEFIETTLFTLINRIAGESADLARPRTRRADDRVRAHLAEVGDHGLDAAVVGADVGDVDAGQDGRAVPAGTGGVSQHHGLRAAVAVAGVERGSEHTGDVDGRGELLRLLGSEHAAGHAHRVLQGDRLLVDADLPGVGEEEQVAGLDRKSVV